MSSTNNGYLDTDLAYIAGLFDGEGSISVYTLHRQTRYGTRTVYRLGVKIANTNIITMQWVKDTMDIGGSLGDDQTGINRTCYYLCYGENRAARFLELVLPYLRIKQEQAKIALELKCRITQAKSGSYIGKTEYGIRNEIYQRLLDLKSKEGKLTWMTKV